MMYDMSINRFEFLKKCENFIVKILYLKLFS